MSESVPLRDKYLALIDEIVQATLKGKISSQGQVYQMLLKGISVGTGEVFELVLSENLDSTQRRVDGETDELKKAKITRSLRALKTIQSQWKRVEEQNKATESILSAVREITTSPENERLTIFLRVTDPNSKQPLNQKQLQQLAKSLQQNVETFNLKSLEEFSQGIARGISSCEKVQQHLISWMYEQNRSSIGFAGVSEESGPWTTWAKQVDGEFSKELFRILAKQQSPVEFARNQRIFNLSDWVELTLILQFLQRGLVNWFDQQAYNVKAGSNLSISTYLTFAVIWSQLGNGFGADTAYGSAAWQIVLQILRNFSQRPYFPLYGGIVASFSGNYLKDALSYLDEPLRRVEGTQEKARILTILGYSQRALGQYESSVNFHQQALEIARNFGDRACEVANLNHLSRSYVDQKNYAEAINNSQRALILSRQTGDKISEANALANLGNSEVMQAHLSSAESETYEMAINYLQQGLNLSEKLGDLQSKALCLSSLGIAYLVTEKPADAIKYLEEGFKTAQTSGDLYLQGLNLTNLAEANYSLASFERAIYTASLGMYILNQIASREWYKPAKLLSTLQNQLGESVFKNLLGNNRPKIITFIGVDGYDYIPQLIEEYRNNS
ncbi:MAG: tetratricopeptide repeat protein [Richelia sp. RM2_1_2]|nr:tetratricopeptide repeat protein [Richelia sp. SM2_1_7]NJM21541.1 tetratricopeptide repeat protein [Richelia sp. SM1_7_0]NJN09203.1 tetratricopeptide repeat protein [Richelia sp. RM1_1_1]NJO61844.1 tetratricopeptide repeat protein [Richelia sp. RM2_1_2]